MAPFALPALMSEAALLLESMTLCGPLPAAAALRWRGVARRTGICSPRQRYQM